MHSKTRLELIIERPALRRAESLLEESGVIGWTVLPAISGRGARKRWSRGTDISGASDMVVLVAIGGTDIIEAAVETLAELLSSHIGVLNISAVQVVRPTKF
jgi:nitrogen regulatory protein PII